MSIFSYEMRSGATTSYYSGVAYCDINGKSLPCRIQTAGHGKFGNGTGTVHSDNYTDGVFGIFVSGSRRFHSMRDCPANGEMVISHYKIDGTVTPFAHEDFAPESVRRFAEIFCKEADCYHCRCLESHLQTASAG